MNQKQLKELIKKLVHEYGTGDAASTGLTSDDGNNITSQRSRFHGLHGEEEMEFYLNQNKGMGGDGGHYKKYPAKNNMGLGRQKLTPYLEEEIEEEMEEQAYGSATLTTQGSSRSGAKAPTENGEYPYTRFPKRTASGYFEQKILKEDPARIAQLDQEIQQLNKKAQDKQFEKQEVTIDMQADAATAAAAASTKPIKDIEATIVGFNTQEKEYLSEKTRLTYELEQIQAKDGLELTPEEIERWESIPGEIQTIIEALKKLKLDRDKAIKQKENLMKTASKSSSAAQAGITQARKALRKQKAASKTGKSGGASGPGGAGMPPGMPPTPGLSESKKLTEHQKKHHRAKWGEPSESPKQIIMTDLSESAKRGIKILDHYMKDSKNKSNLIENIEKHRKDILLEGAMKKFFKQFNQGKTDEEVLRLYAEQGVVVPEQFVKKAREQYKKLKQEKLNITNLEQETKEFKKIATLNEPAEEDKALSDRLFKEEKKKKKSKGKINIDTDEVEVLDDVDSVDSVTINVKESEIIKKYKIPQEIEDALVNKLKMNPLIRFVQNLKAVNSIPPSYRVFLLNGKHLDIFYQDDGLMAKIEKKEYYLDDKIGSEGINYAVKHVNRLMTEPIISTGDEEGDLDMPSAAGIKPPGAGPSKPPTPPPPPPPMDEPEDE